MFDDIQSVLQPSDKSAKRDINTFHDWEIGLIDTETCLRKFRKSNYIRAEFVLGQDRFVEWLHSLGWHRHGV